MSNTTKRHPRTAAEAFKDADYAGAVYRYPRPRRTRWGLWLAFGVTTIAYVIVRFLWA